MNSASTRRPRLEVLDDVAQESGFWRFLGTVAIPTVGVALLTFAIGYLPTIALHHDPALFIQPGAGGSPVFDIPHEQLQAVRHGAHSLGPTVTNAVSTEKSPVEPFPFERPLAVPGEFPPPVTIDGDEPQGRIEPAPQVADRAESGPTKLEASTPDAGPSEPPRDLATIPRSVPLTPEPRMPEPPTLEPSVEVQQAELPASPESTPQAPVRSQPGPEQPVSPRPGPRVEAKLEPPPAKAAPEPPAILQATPAPRSGPPAAENPQVALVRPGPAALLEKLLPPGRGRGHKLLAQLAATASTESCDGRELPFFRVIEANVLPARLEPGGRFSHRLVYALCTAGPDSRLTATVTRELRGSAGVVLVDRTDSFRLRPGTWASDEDLAVPPNANPGRYSVNTTVTFGGRVWTEQTDLLIE